MSALSPGLADPVRDSQAVFRAVLDAMARPGRIHTIAAPLAPPPKLDRATAAVLLTLVDAETPLCLDGEAAAARDWIAFHAGAPIVPRHTAQFVVLPLPNGEGSLFLDLVSGTDEEPESAATLILQLPALGEGDRYRLEGPGLAAPARFAAAGLPRTFLAEWEANRRLFPRGVDLILTAGDRLAALPRTVRIEAG